VQNLPPSSHERLDPWLSLWYRGVADSFFDAYASGIPDGSPILGELSRQTDRLLEFFLFEKALYELRYEANNRPDWVDIPAMGILDLLDG
jgi:maltose alpha-D-glucosyltransferase / alpha-amylase